jgi:hypothetical protein
MERVALSRWPSRRMRFASRASRVDLSVFAADQVPDAVSHRDGQRAEEELPQEAGSLTWTTRAAPA